MYCCGLLEVAATTDPKAEMGNYGMFATIKSSDTANLKKFEDAGWKCVYEFPGRYSNQLPYGPYTMKMFVKPQLKPNKGKK